jgi:hypothetical protein
MTKSNQADTRALAAIATAYRLDHASEKPTTTSSV